MGSGAQAAEEQDQVGRALLARERLLERYRARWHHPVTLLVAPAGYGKSALLMQAVAANSAEPVGIERIVTCWPGMTAASSLGGAIHRALTGMPDLAPHGGVEVWARVVIELVWRLSPQQVVLAIDDVHEIADETDAARLLDALVAGLPANGHLVLSGREAPPVRLARLEVEGRIATLDHADLTLTDDEVEAFASLRGAPTATVASCAGWPALAELLVSAGGAGAEDAPPSAVRDYVGQEILSHLTPGTRDAVGVLAYLGPFDTDLAQAALGSGIDVPALLDGLPLVGGTADGEWYLHEMWQALLERDPGSVDPADARRRAGLVLVGKGRTDAGIWRLIDAEAWDDVLRSAVGALGDIHPPVARDLVADWLSRLPADLRSSPGGQLLASVATSEADPAAAAQRLEACRKAFQEAGDTPGEISCLVQLGHFAWWFDDEGTLAGAVARVFELEAEGWTEMEALAHLGRAALADMANDSHGMMAELDLIEPGSLSDGWDSIARWMRAYCLLDLGHTSEALAAADAALARADSLHIPLTHTRLQALWYQGRTSEVLSVVPDLVRRVEASGYEHHMVLLASYCVVMHGLVGQRDQAAGHLARARAVGVGTGLPEAPPVATSLTVAEAVVAIGEGEEAAAARALADLCERIPVHEGISAATQRRYVAFFYVLVPGTRPVWDEAEIGPAWEPGRSLARALVSIREGRGLPADLPLPDDVGIVRAHLPPTWVAELALGAVAAGRDEGRRLLDQTWQLSRPVVADIAQRKGHPLARTAKGVLGEFPVLPGRRLRLRLLGPVELLDSDELVNHRDWRRERVRLLLANLVLRPVVTRTELADDLWPDLHPEGQAHNLRVTLSYLLRVLEPDRDRRAPSYFVRRHGNNLSLHADDQLTVDVWDFDAACARAAEADRRGVPGDELDAALEAVELWRGDPVEVASESWAITLAEERRQRYAAMAVRAGELLLAQGDEARAGTLAEQALEVDPWSDAAHRLVVAGHHAAGDDLAAHRALRRYRAAVQELGLGPDRATLMVERLLDNLPAGGRTSSDERPGSGRTFQERARLSLGSPSAAGRSDPGERRSR